MSDERLKPCPFCGGEARISADTEAVRDSEGRLWAFTVVCDKCCATSGLTYSPKKAIEAWNTRKPMERIVEKLEERQKAFICKKTEPCDYPERIGCCYDRAINDAIDIVKAGGVDE